MFDLLGKTMEIPVVFGSFHLTFFISFIVFAFILLFFFKDCDEKTFKRIVFVGWIILVVFEVLKQITFNYDYEKEKFKDIYCWPSFPYQFCSLPYYIWPIILLLNDTKDRNVLCAFAGTYMFFGGFAYFFFPVSFCEYIIVNIQTMVHHGMQASIGLFIFNHEYEKMKFKTFLKSFFVLLITVGVAILLNVTISLGLNVTNMNLFELNPIYHTEALVFKDILNATNYPIFLFTYIAGFFVFASTFYFIFIYSRKLINKLKIKKYGD